MFAANYSISSAINGLNGLNVTFLTVDAALQQMSTFRCFVLNLITDEFHLSGEQFLILIYVQIITQSAFTARCIVALGSRVLDSSSSSPTGSQAQARGQRRRRFDAFQ